MSRSTLLADYLMLPWSLAAKAITAGYGAAVKVPAYVLPVGAVVAGALVLNRLLNQRRSP